MPPDPSLPPRSSKELQVDELRHWRHLIGNEHFQFFLEEVSRKHLQPALQSALDEALPGKTRRVHLAKYHTAREVVDLVFRMEKTLSDLLESKPKGNQPQ